MSFLNQLLNSNRLNKFRGPLIVVLRLGALLSGAVTTLGQGWTPTSAPIGPWRALACSADGNRIVIAGAQYTDFGFWNPFGIFISSDSGQSWIETAAPSNSWVSVASSASGSKLVAAAAGNAGYGTIYASSDSGKTWVLTTAPANSWASIACSADGSKLVATSSEGLYTSLDSGATWHQPAASTNLGLSVAASADGTTLFAEGVGGLVYISTNSGADWKPSSAISSNGWSSISCSADGRTVVAASGLRGFPSSIVYTDGPVNVSTNSGASWNQTAVVGGWVASSADGSKLVVGGNGWVYVSSDSGASWTKNDWRQKLSLAVCTSVDGSKILAAGGYTPSEGLIYTAPYSGPWRAADVPRFDWSSIAISADGAKMAASCSEGIYASTNSGTNWVLTPLTNNQSVVPWIVGASADGSQLVAALFNGLPTNGMWLYTSRDWGASWKKTPAPSNPWSSLAVSEDGTKLFAAATLRDNIPFPIYSSFDSGVSWMPSGAPVNCWSSVACSSDGTKLVAAGSLLPGLSSLFTSTDSGATWLQTDFPTLIDPWSSVASSADGGRLIASTGFGGIFTSSDSGTNWNQAVMPENQWSAVASSADGTTLVAVAAIDRDSNPGSIYISRDGGVTWARANSPDANWTAISSSADGNNLVAVAFDDGFYNGGGIYTLHFPLAAPPTPKPPQLSINPTGGGLVISWLVPSAPFVLQETSDLTNANWANVPVAPEFNFDNIHFEIRLPAPSGNKFYRLEHE